MGSGQSIQYTLTITNQNKHIFMCPLEIHISSSVNCLLILCEFLYRVVFFCCEQLGVPSLLELF